MKFLVTENQFKLVISRLQEKMEEYFLNEGINEDQALKILKDNNVENAEEILKFLSDNDKSKNHKMLPPMVAFYINASNSEEFGKIINTFQKLFELIKIDKSGKPIPIPAPEVSFLNGKIKILDQSFGPNEFSNFEDFIDHYYFKETTEEHEDKTLFETDANIKFENDKFIVYEAPSPHVCIKLFGYNNEGRLYVSRGFCIGTGNLLEPSTQYRTHRLPTGDWGITFYVVLDKEKYQKYLETKQEEPSLLNVIGVRDGRLEDHYIRKSPFIDHIDDNTILSYFVWDENNPGPGYPVRAFGTDQDSVSNYIRYLESNGINTSKIFKPKKYIEIKNDTAVSEMVKHQGSERGDILFFNLTAKQKFIYISRYAKTLTPRQVEFVIKKMPEYIIEGFINNFEKLGDLSVEAFNKLPVNLEKKFIDKKLIQLFSKNNLFNENNFFNYMINDDYVNYSVNKIKNSFDDERNPNINKEYTRKVLGLLIPEYFLETLKTVSSVKINNENYRLKQLPENFGEYLENADELILEDLKIVSIPESIGMAKKLKTLTITNCPNLSFISPTIGLLTNLEDVNIINCGSLEKLPDSIGQLVNLSHLNLSDNNLKTLPESIANLKNVYILNLEGNPIESLPIDALNKMDSLEIVVMSQNGEIVSLHKGDDGWQEK